MEAVNSEDCFDVNQMSPSDYDQESCSACTQTLKTYALSAIERGKKEEDLNAESGEYFQIEQGVEEEEEEAAAAIRMLELLASLTLEEEEGDEDAFFDDGEILLVMSGTSVFLCELWYDIG